MDNNRTSKLVPLLLLITMAVSVIALVLAVNANMQSKDAQDKVRTHHHSSTTSGTEVKENDTRGPDYLMDGSNSPAPTQ